MCRPSQPAGPLRPCLRARRLRRRLRRRHARPAAATASSSSASRSLCNLDHRGATGAEANVGDGAGILIQVPDRFLRAVVDFDLPARRRVRRRHRLPARGPGRRRAPRWPAIEKIAASEGLRVLGWRDVPDRRLDDRPDGRATPSRRSGSCSSPPARASRSRGIDLDRRRFVVRKRIEHEVAPTASRVLPVAVGPHARLQGHAHHAASSPTSSRPRRRALRVGARARALPVLDQHVPVVAARAPVPLIAHNGEINTVMGNENWMRAREALLASDAHPRPRPRLPDLHARRVATRPLRRGARAAAPRRPLAAARRADDDPRGVGEPRVDARRQAGLLPVPRVADGAVGRPGVDRVHRRHGHRRGARPQRPAPVALLGHRPTASSSWRPRSACSTSTRPTIVQKGRLQPGRMFLVDTDAGPHRRRRRDQGRSSRAEQPYGEWLHAGLVHLDDLPHAPLPHAAARLGRAAAAGVRVHDRGAQDPPRADGEDRRRADRLDGHRHADRRAVGPAPPAVRLLPAAVRAGHQPAARRDPRGARHVARRARSAPRATCSTRRRRRAGRSCCRTRSSTTTTSPSCSTSTRTATIPGFKPFADRRALPGRRRRRRVCAARSTTCAPKVSDAIARRRQAHHPLRPPLERRAGADPVAAARRRRCTTT